MSNYGIRYKTKIKKEGIKMKINVEKEGTKMKINVKKIVKTTMKVTAKVGVVMTALMAINIVGATGEELFKIIDNKQKGEIKMKIYEYILVDGAVEITRVRETETQYNVGNKSTKEQKTKEKKA